MISTSHLILRKADPTGDAPEVLAMMLDAQTRCWNSGGAVVDLTSAAAWATRQADWSDGSHASFAIVEAASGRYAGSVSVHSVDPHQADAEIGYRVAPWARGRGYAIEAVAAASSWAFQNLPVVRIELCHAVANPASCAVATKVGFSLEGLLRSSYVYGDGQRYDEHLHARLATDA